MSIQSFSLDDEMFPAVLLMDGSDRKQIWELPADNRGGGGDSAEWSEPAAAAASFVSAELILWAAASSCFIRKHLERRGPRESDGNQQDGGPGEDLPLMFNFLIDLIQLQKAAKPTEQ